MNSSFNINWANSRGKMLRGAYHYYEASADPVEQARWFVKNVDWADAELPGVLDLEDRTGVSSKSVYASRIFAFLAELELLSGDRPIIYTSLDYWNVYVGSYGSKWADGYPLWVANYRSDSGPLVPLPWIPTNYHFWQFTSHADGHKYGTESANVDLNIFNGSMADLYKFRGDQFAGINE